MLDYNTYFKNLPPVPPCTTVNLVLDGNITKTTQGSCVVSADTETISYTNTYRFKTLSGNIMEHKSPTDEEYGIQLQEMITPSLPSDRDRYVDYLDKNLQYKKIVYPNLFRIVLDSTELDYPGAQKQIKNLLDQKTSEIR